MNERRILLQKLHSGIATKKDLERLLDLIQASPQENDEDVMRELWDQIDNFTEMPESQGGAIMNRTLSLIGKDAESKMISTSDQKNKSLAARSKNLGFGTIAAAVIFLVVGSFSFYFYSEQIMLTASAEYGEQVEITLPDRSIVTLNSNSSIKYKRKWDQAESRKVHLQGEAFFEVRKNLAYEQKFEVLTNDLKVEVLGTSFNVNAREEMTTVFLEEGAVNLDLEDKEEDIGMTPGEVVTYSRKKGVPQRNMKVEEVPASWKDGTVEFEDSPLLDILERLKEIYGVELVYESETYLDRRYRLSLPIERLDVAFAVLKEVTGLNLVSKNNKIIVK